MVRASFFFAIRNSLTRGLKEYASNMFSLFQFSVTYWNHIRVTIYLRNWMSRNAMAKSSNYLSANNELAPCYRQRLTEGICWNGEQGAGFNKFYTGRFSNDVYRKMKMVFRSPFITGVIFPNSNLHWGWERRLSRANDSVLITFRG